MDTQDNKEPEISVPSTEETNEVIAKLEKENQKLKELNAMRTDLISLNAHQLRTSLSAIKWILKMFLDNDFGNLTEEQRGIFIKTSESNERAIELVNQMLAANKAEEFDVNYKFEKINIIDLIRKIVFEFQAEAYRNNIQIIFENPTEEFPPVLIDQDRIRIVFQNLIENAIRYNKMFGKVFISVKKIDNKLQISIRDTGIGISTENEDKIFEKFFRAKNAVKISYTGTGLGLFNSKKIITKHGGDMWFESKENEGSTFYFTVPLAP